MKKNSYIKILLLLIGVFVRLQASEGYTAQQAGEDYMVQVASLMQNLATASVSLEPEAKLTISDELKEQAQTLMLQFPDIKDYSYLRWKLIDPIKGNPSLVNQQNFKSDDAFRERVLKAFGSLIQSTPAYKFSKACDEVDVLFAQFIRRSSTSNLGLDSSNFPKSYDIIRALYTGKTAEQVTAIIDAIKGAIKSHTKSNILVNLAKDIIESSLSPVYVGKSADEYFNALNSSVIGLTTLINQGDPNLDDYSEITSDSVTTFMQSKINDFIIMYPAFFKDIEINILVINPSLKNSIYQSISNTLSSNHYYEKLRALLNQNKNFKSIRAIAELTENLNQINIGKKGYEAVIAEYLYLKTAYNEILENYSQDPSFGALKELFESKITTYTNLQVVIEYQEKTSEYELGLAAFLKSPTIENAKKLKSLAGYSYNRAAFFSDETLEELKEKINSSKLDPLSKFIIGNILFEKSLEYQSSPKNVEEYAKAIESLFKTFDLRLDVSKVENFLKTGDVPEDRWFKNVFTKMKRAFGLSKDVDIVDVTNLLKEFEKGNFFHAQSLGAVTQELQEALLKDPALMYKLLPEKAKSFIKQFDNIKGFKNKLLEAYFKDKAEYDESFKDGSDERTRAAGLTKLIKAAVALSVNSDQKDTIVAALDRNFSDYAKGLQITIVEAFETNIGNLPENMAAYREDNPVINLPPKKLVSNLLVAGQPEVAGLPVVAGQLEAGQQVAGQLVDNIGV